MNVSIVGIGSSYHGGTSISVKVIKKKEATEVVVESCAARTAFIVGKVVDLTEWLWNLSCALSESKHVIVKNNMQSLDIRCDPGNPNGFRSSVDAGGAWYVTQGKEDICRSPSK